MSGAEGSIFISYRRQESSHIAGRLYDRLSDLFGTDRVFIDVDTIKPGVNFVEAIDHAIATSRVLLAIIGPHWLTATDESGHRRLDDPDDIIRLEIEAALTRNVLVVPILVEGAEMPGRQDLPESLAGLVLRNAHRMRHESFRSDVEQLVASISGIIRPGSQSTSRPGTAEERRWKLEPVASSASVETVRLSSGTETHDITYKYKMFSNDTITVDGKVQVSKFHIDDKEYPLSLSSIVGTGVTIKIEPPLLFGRRHMILKIGNQVLIHEMERLSKVSLKK